MRAALRERGEAVGRRRVARLMRRAGLRGVHGQRRRVRTTAADPRATPASAGIGGPNQLWLGDITYLPTGEGWLYLAVLLDAHSRRCVGWALADHLRTAQALDALAMALARRRPGAGPTQHTDRGCQYTVGDYQAALAAQGVVASMSPAGNCLDNTMAESVFSTLKTELADRQVWPSRAAARTAIFAWLAVWYNRQRRHPALAYQAPVTFEEAVLVLSDRAA